MKSHDFKEKLTPPQRHISSQFSGPPSNMTWHPPPCSL